MTAPIPTIARAVDPWAKLAAMNAAFADMVAAARNFDGSYEAAKARFQVAKEMLA